jgi:uncharacterized protein
MATIHMQTIPVFIKYLNIFKHILTKAEAHCDAKGIPHDEILQATVAPDMKP